MSENILARSSRKGYFPDNASCEDILDRVKKEMFYNEKLDGISIDEFIDVLYEYLTWYNEKSIRMSLGAMNPLRQRRSIDLVA